MDLGIVIALKEEFREFMALLPVQPTSERDPQTGQYAYVFELPGSGRRCVVTLIGEMNPEPAALQTERLLSHWAPRAVVMLGIAAGIHPDVRVGDVVIASQVDNYLATAKAQGGSTPDAFEFSLGGTVFHADFNFVTQVRNFEFFAREVFSRWQQECAQVLAELVPAEAVRTALLQKRLVRAAPDLLDAHLASDSVVGAAQQFTQWLRSKRDRNLKALDMESAGFMAAAVRRMEPARTLVIRGISDYGDERKHDLDAVGEGALRRYAMRNATRLLWALLEAGVLSRVVSEAPERRSAEPLDSRRAPFIGISVETLKQGFKGREKALEDLHALLQGTSRVALTSGASGRVLAHGGGGIGKSRLAIEYAYRYRDAYPGGVFFARVEKRAPQELFAEFARLLFGGQELSRDDEAAVSFLQRLGHAELGRQLIIFDDLQADSREELAGRFGRQVAMHGELIWPLEHAHVSLLITTRIRELAWASGFAVERLEPEPARDLLIEKAAREPLEPAEWAVAMELASEVLGGHPLAISLAGAYIRRGGFLFSQYMRFIHAKGLTDRLEEAARKVGSEVQDHERSIAATYELSREQLASGRAEDVLAENLLQTAAFLEPGIPMDPRLLLLLLRARGFSADLEAIGLALARLTQDLALLDPARGLGAGAGEVIIHPLIADYTRWSLKEEDRERTRRAFLECLSELFPDKESELWKITQPDAGAGWEWLSPHREMHIASVWESAQTVATIHRARLSRALGSLYIRRGDLWKARLAFRQGLEMAERSLAAGSGDEQWPREVALCRFKLGEVLMEQRRLHEAREAFEQGLKVAEPWKRRAPGDEQRQGDLSAGYDGLGDVLHLQGDRSGARSAYQESLALARRLAERDPARAQWQWAVAVGLAKLGGLMFEQGDSAGTRRAYEESLAIMRRLVEGDPNHAHWQGSLAATLSELGGVLQEHGDWQGARGAYEEALAMTRRLAGRDPSNTQWQGVLAEVLSRLGDVMLKQSDRQGARRAYEESLEIALRLVKQDPTNASWRAQFRVVLRDLVNLLITEAAGEHGEARKLLTRMHESFLGLAMQGTGAQQQSQLLRYIEFRLRRLAAPGHEDQRSGR